MPIVIPRGEEGLGERLRQSGAAVIGEAAALHQDIRPARIGLLNLMPAATMESTEQQWLRYISHTVLQIEPVLMKFDDDFREREGASRSQILGRYQPLSSVAEQGLDGLIVTGDNLELKAGIDIAYDRPELLPFTDIQYAKPLAETIDWARSNVRSTVYSCLASHYALHHLFGIERQGGDRKIFGVFEHVLNRTDSNFTVGMDDTVAAPHSRWGDMPPEELENAGIQLLAVSREVGWLLAQSKNQAGGDDLFIQGHPEYDRYDLHAEYQRDRDAGQKPPQNYYRAEQPRLTWVTDARALHGNWIASLYDSFSQL